MVYRVTGLTYCDTMQSYGVIAIVQIKTFLWINKLGDGYPKTGRACFPLPY
jgi:hypothetical protein